MADRKIKHESMTLEEFGKISDAPCQRNTLKHSTTASRPGGHLATYNPVHRMVSIAEADNGKRWVLDGHSRRFLWKSGSLEHPPTNEKLIVTVIPVKNKAEAISMYHTYDNRAATESNTDLIFGALNYYNVTLHHGFLFQNVGLMSAIEFTIFPPKFVDLKNISTIQRMKPWVKTIEVMDQTGDFPNHRLFRSPILLAALLTFRKHGNTATSFWQGYSDDIGRKSEKSCDGIFACRDAYQTMTIEQGNKWGRRIFNIYTPVFLHCFDQWIKDKRMQKFKRIEGARMPKEMLSVREWWRVNLGELDQPQIRIVKDTDEQLELI